MTDLSPAMTLGDIVARDLRSAAILERHGLDFCCGGRRSLEEACRARGIDAGELVRELGAADARTAAEDAGAWPLERVVDRILQQHHVYVRRQIPIIQSALRTLVEKKGHGQPILIALADTFDRLATALTHHLAKEESILFPFIQAMIEAQAQQQRLPRTPFGTIQNPVRVMELEHQHAGEDMRHIRDLTSGFQPPAEACPTWRACYRALADFERDLHEHVHLENNVLFPAAARLEEELA